MFLSNHFKDIVPLFRSQRKDRDTYYLTMDFAGVLTMHCDLSDRTISIPFPCTFWEPPTMSKKKIVSQINLPLSMQHSVSDDATDMIKGLTEALNRLCSDFESFSTPNLVKGVFSSIKNEVLQLLPILIICTLLFQHTVNGGSTKQRLLLVSILSAFKVAVSLDIQTKLAEFLSGIHTHSGTIKPQGAEDFGNFTQSLISLCLFACTGIKSGGPFKFSLLERVVTLGRTRDNFVKGLDAILGVIHDLCVYLKQDYLASLFSPLAIQTLEGLESWVKECDTIFNAFHDSTLPINRDNYDRVYSAILRGMHLISESRSKGVYDKVKATTSAYLNNLRKVSVVFEQANFGQGQFRSEPLTIMFTGKPGVGKSAATIFFLSDIMSKVLPRESMVHFKDHPTDYVYMRKNEHKYWDGYHGQFCTVFDDFGQQRDFSQNLESEYMDIIRICNTFPHICHMASIENKGNVEFRSKIVLLTTNMPRLMCESINEVEAVQRRIDVYVQVVPKLEYCLPGPETLHCRRLDLTKVNGAFDDAIYEMHLLDPCTGQELQILGYHELVQHCVTLYNRKHRFSDAYLGELKKRLVTSQGAFDNISSLEELSLYSRDTDEIDRIMSRIYRLTPQSITSWPRPTLLLLIDYLRREDPKAYEFLSTSQDTDFPYVLRTIFDSDTYQGFTASLRRDTTFSIASAKAGEFFATIRDTIAQAVSKFPVLSMIIAATGVVTTALSMYSAFNSADDDVDPQSVSGQEPRLKVSTRPKIIRSGFLARPQMGGQQSSQMVNALLSRNVYEVVSGDTGSVLGNLLVIKDRLCIYPYHFATRLRALDASGERPELKEILLVNDLLGYTYHVSIAAFIDLIKCAHLESLDYCAVELPGTFRRHRDISRLFAPESHIVNLKHPQLRLSILVDNMINSMIVKAEPEFDRSVNDDVKPYVIHRGFSYRVPTRSGDCGALLTLESVGPSSGKIVGFHVAGDSNDLGISNLITYEDVAHIRNPIAPQSGLDNTTPFTELGTLEKPLVIATKSKIVPSRLYSDLGPARTTPAFLRPTSVNGIRLDPMAQAISKYAFIYKPEEQEMIHSIDHAFDMLLAAGATNYHRYKRVLSSEEAILGVVGLEFVEPIPRNTSAGYPFCVDRSHKGKTHWLGETGDVDVTTLACRELIDLMESDEALIREGQNPDYFFMDFLKDERRPVDKVLAGKTRLVSGCPIVLTLLTRKYFAGFAGWVMANHISNSCAVGINVYSQAWDILTRKLNTFGPNILCGDFSNFDGSLRPEYLKRIGHNINKWYDDQYSSIRQVLWQNVYESKHVNSNRKYAFKQGLPSGHPMTSIINSIYNMSAIIFAYNNCLGVDSFILPIEEHLRFVVYGDDNVIACSPQVKGRFSVTKLLQAFDMIGLKYTPPTKDGSELAFGSIETASFLKRGFIMDCVFNRYVAALSLEVILETPLWTKTGPLRYEIAVGNVCDSLEELSLHPKGVFDVHSEILLESCLKHYHFVPKVLSYLRLKHQVLARDQRW